MTTIPDYDKLINALRSIKKLDKGFKDNTKEIYTAQTDFKKLVTQEFKFSPEKYYKCKVTQREKVFCDTCKCEVLCLKSHVKTTKHQRKETIAMETSSDSADTVIRHICEEEEAERTEIEKLSDVDFEKILKTEQV